jgi:excisionase family DNA binding protein
MMVGMSVVKLDTAVVLTVKEAAAMAKVSEWTIRREIREGGLKARHIGTCVRVTRMEFDRWLAGDAADPCTADAVNTPDDG